MRLVVYAATLALLCNAVSVRAQFLLPVTVAQPHPAVVRVVVPEKEGTAYGSGTLIDVRDDFGLVLTNWHVVRDAAGAIDVVFPSGFRSQARSLKVDSEWDLAALVIWRPPCEPVPLATRAPRPGDRLTICGYGQGDYRAVSGRCTQFYSPRLDLPRELVELDVEARQGDSGGPIFNDRGELAGVLFGAGQGTTLGSFEGRVKTFLASLAPDIGAHGDAPQVALKPVRSKCDIGGPCQSGSCSTPDNDLGGVAFGRKVVAEHNTEPWPTSNARAAPEDDWPQFGTADPATPDEASAPPVAAGPLEPANWFERGKNVLALVGALAIVIQFVRLIG